MLLGDARALVVGITRYQTLPPLPPARDAEDIAAVLADPACCGYPPAAVTTLVDAAATRAAILAALDGLATTTAASTVFLYFSCHGARSVAGDTAYYLCPHDASNASRADLERTALSSRALIARLHAIPAGRLTLILDCCRAAPLGDAALTGDDVAPLAQGRGRVVLAASRASDVAYVDAYARNSQLTGFLLAGLRGAATAVHGVIRICDLFQYVQEQAAAAPPEQRPHPVFKAELEENYPIAFAAPAPLVLPPAPDAAAYDAFLSYCPADRAWVARTLVPFLEGLGLVLCLPERDFAYGRPLVAERDRAVSTSRYTICVLTPAYFADPYSSFTDLLAGHAEVEARAPRVIPLLREAAPLALHTRMTALLDATSDAELPAILDRLALLLRQPARPRLT
jgi:hypothetical protein